MASTKILWYILVDQDKNLIRNVSHVAAVNSIWELKDTIKAIESPFLQDVQSSRIRVWRCPDYTFDDDDSQLLSRKVKEAFSTNQVKHLSEMRTIEELKLIESEVLLIEVHVHAGELPGTSRISSAVGHMPFQAIGTCSSGEPFTSKAGREYGHLFLRAGTKGEFTDDDVNLNEIFSNSVQVPGFVDEFEKTLSRKRKAAENVACFLILSCFRLLLTNEARCARCLKRSTVKGLILIIQQRLPLRSLPLLTSLKLPTLPTFRPSMGWCHGPP